MELAWMKVKSKEDSDGKALLAFAQLLQYNSWEIEDPFSGSIAAYFTSVHNEDLFKNMKKIDEDATLSLLGFGEAWYFEDIQNLIDLIIENRDKLLDSIRKEADRSYVQDIFDLLEKKGNDLETVDNVFRIEDFDVMGGFDEFVWCSVDACNVPAEYNGRLLDDGRMVGKDDFPASLGLTDEDIPYCKDHYEEKLQE